MILATLAGLYYVERQNMEKKLDESISLTDRALNAGENCATISGQQIQDMKACMGELTECVALEKEQIAKIKDLVAVSIDSCMDELVLCAEQLQSCEKQDGNNQP